jgi:MFS family permease
MTLVTNTNPFSGRRGLQAANRAFWSAQAVSLLGRWVHGFALSWHVYQTTHSAFWLGLVAALSSLPALALSPIAGAAIDRYPLRRLLLATQVALMLLASITAVLAMMSALEGAALLALSLVFGVVTAFDAPAFQAWLVEESGEEGLDLVIARQSFAINATKIAAPFVAAELVFFLGTGACFLLNALSYLPLALIVLVSRERCGQPMPGHEHDGTPAVDSHARGTLALVGDFAFLGLPCFSLMPSITGEVLGGGLRSFSLVMTSVAAGAFAASAVFWHDATHTRRHALIPWSVLVFAASLFALFAPVGAFGHCLFAAAAGAAVCVLLTLCNHSLQAGLENRGRGRVTSLYAGVVLGLPPLGTLLLGGLGDLYGMRGALTIDCALLATLAVATIARLPRRQCRRVTTDAGTSSPQLPPRWGEGARRARGEV